MKGSAMGVAIALAAIAQVTVAPLFPISGAVPDFVLLTLVLLVAFSSARPVMIGTPLVAIAYGFLSNRSPALLLLAYLPILPLGYFLEESPVPANHYLRALGMMLLTGLWARTLLALAAISAGAQPAFGVLVSDVLIPGLFLDFALLSVAYVPLRLIGWTGQGMALGRTGFYARL
jgi:cell shape-determining protein MreD